MKNKRSLLRSKEEKNALNTIKPMNTNPIVQTLRSNCLLKHFVEGKTKGKNIRDEKTGKRH
jgi:hypothetical protein